MDPPHINYVNNNSLLVVNHKGKIRQLFVPFRVQALFTTSKLTENAWVIVEEVMIHNQYKLIYRISDLWFPYYVFRLSVVF